MLACPTTQRHPSWGAKRTRSPPEQHEQRLMARGGEGSATGGLATGAGVFEEEGAALTVNEEDGRRANLDLSSSLNQDQNNKQ